MKKKMSGIWMFWIIILFFGYLVLSALWEDYYIKNKGVEISVTVSMCKIERIGNRSPVDMWCSSGYYWVHNKKYRHIIKGRVLPIGTKFSIKYDPRNPNKSLLVNPHEFDNYPDEMKVQN